MAASEDGNAPEIANKSRLTVVERYYTCKYKLDVNKCLREDMCVLCHSNRVCVITVAKSHPIVAEKKSISNIDFQVDGATNRLDNKVSGKGKKGAQWLNPSSALCHVTCEDGSKYTLYSCIRGHLVEVNENLIEDPQLITTKPMTDGYLAIVLCKLKEQEEEMKRLLSQEQYDEAMKKRQENG